VYFCVFLFFFVVQSLSFIPIHAQTPADTLEVQMERLRDEGDYNGALLAAERLMQHYSLVVPIDSVRYVHALSRHAKFLSYAGRLDEALQEGERVCDYYRRNKGPQSADYATAQLDMAGYHSRSGHYTEAVRLGEVCCHCANDCSVPKVWSMPRR